MSAVEAGLRPGRRTHGARIPFTDHAGRGVYHCHLLDHEDLGVMGTINIRG
jgi:FtsP/CotA-like multicopper oxidase with cupredoxin domain